MFYGKEYASYGEILLKSFRSMNSTYQGQTIAKNGFTRLLQFIYIRIFGIPEIGFQLRNLYFRKILSEIKGFSPETILDVGSGIGFDSLYLARKYPAVKVEGWEIDRDKLSFSKDYINKKNIKNVKFSYGDISRNLKQANKYDLIVNIDVLEHIKNYRKVLDNFYSLLKKDGYLYLHVPRIKQARHLKSLTGWQHDGHEREGFDQKTLPNELKSAGFKIVKQINTFGFIGSWAWEINHYLLSKNPYLALLAFPLINLLSFCDTLKKNKTGLCMAVVARK